MTGDAVRELDPTRRRSLEELFADTYPTWRVR